MSDEIASNIESQEFSFGVLIVPTITVMVIGYIVSRYILKKRLPAFFISFFKALIFFVYFYFFYNGEYNSGVDDYYYIEKGRQLLSKFQNESFYELDLINIAESFHFFYIIVSAFAQYLFGEFYFSLVALNVIASYFCGVFSYRIIVNQYSNTHNAKIFYVSTLMYPDVLAWSSVFAGKDIFVLLGHLLFIYAFTFVLQKKKLKGAIKFVAAFVYMLNLRFYVALIFLPLLLRGKIYVFLIFIALIFISLFTNLPYIFSSLFSLGLSSIINFDILTILSMPANIFHFWLTPRPFFETREYEFLLVGNIFNWITFPLMFYGLISTLRSMDIFARFIAIYFLSFSLFYGIVDFLRGPRHRLQLTFALIFFLWIAVSKFKKIKKH